MKRLIALIPALAVLFTLAACGASPAGDDSLPEVPEPEGMIEDPEPEPEHEETGAAVFWYDYYDEYLSNVREALDKELNAAGIMHFNYDAENTQSTQNGQVDDAISNGANLLIVNIVDTASIDAAQGICSKAKETGIPVIFFDREVDDSVVNSYENACYVGIRSHEAGEKQGILAGDYLVTHYDEVDLNGDGSISYIMMKGELGIDESRAQFPVEYCNAALTAAGRPELKYYDEKNTDKFQPANWSKQTAFELMKTALATNPMDGNAPIEAAFANNDDSALGVIEALNDAGWNTGGDPAKTIPVFGIDFTPEGQKAIKAGKMTGSVRQSAGGLAETVAALARNVNEGKWVFDGARAAFNTDSYVNKIRVPYEIMTKENA